VLEPAAPAQNRAAWGVAALLLATSDALATRFGAVAVRGELAGFTRAASGHCYFSLKDADGAPALLRCAMFRRAASLVNFAPADGHQVELRGRLGVFEARGELQMVVEAMLRVGTGTLYEEFLRRRGKMAALGYFEVQRKRSITAFPRALGVVTSLGAAALADVLTALQRRAPQVRVVVYPSLVQGAEAPPALVAALQQAAQRAEVDTLLLVRGGGSMEDLWAFNDERVVQAVVASPIPVVCGVGHETDITLADLAADLRAPTPTAAAELAAPVQVELLAQLENRQRALVRQVQRLLQMQGQRLDHTATRLGQPARLVLQQTQRLDELQRRRQRALANGCALQKRQLQQLAQRGTRALQAQVSRQRLGLVAATQALQAHDPRRVLQRGYAWIETEAGQPVVSAHALRPGQHMRAVWADGRALAEIKAVEAPSAPASPPGSRPTEPPLG
jgi:exodeoxyribonuclease VII large subunit